MKAYLTAAIAMSAMLGSGALAQSGQQASGQHMSGQQGSHNPAVKNSHAHMMNAPAHGANSFTEDQARGRLMKAGYTRVSKLKKDDHGVWRGMAFRGGRQVSVGLDYKGNVTR